MLYLVEHIFDCLDVSYPRICVFDFETGFYTKTCYVWCKN